MFNKKIIILMLILITCVVSISLVSASQSNIHEDNGSIPTWFNESIPTWLTVDFHGNQYDLGGDRTIRIYGHADAWYLNMIGEVVHIFVDDQYIGDAVMSVGHPIDGIYSDFTFHDLPHGEHNLKILYYGNVVDGKSPCSYECKIYVNDYNMTVSPDTNINVNNPITINGTLLNEGKPLANAKIPVYINNAWTKDIIYTDDEGHFTYKFTPEKSGNYKVLFKYVTPQEKLIEKTCQIHVSTYNMTVSPDTNINVNNPITINGTLLNEGKPLANAKIPVYINDTWTKDIIYTDDEGHFTYKFTPEKSGNYKVLFKYVTPQDELVEKTCQIHVSTYNMTVSPDTNINVNNQPQITYTMRSINNPLLKVS